MLVDYLRLMNKIYIPGVIVVEGKEDVSYLSSFIDSQFFTTNGYDVSKEKIDFLKRVNEVNRVIILSDNDEAGVQISNKIKSEICGVIVIKTAKLTRKLYKKSGVAETKKDEILKALSPYTSDNKKENDNDDYELNRIISLSQNPGEMKTKLITDYRLIVGNNKFLAQQLKMLKISPEEIKQKYGN